MLNLKNLIGNPILKAHMHGYFIPIDIYTRAVDKKLLQEKEQNVTTVEALYKSKAEAYIKSLTASQIKKASEKDENKPEINLNLYNKLQHKGKFSFFFSEQDYL